MYYNEEYNEMGYDYISGEFIYGDDCYIDEDHMDERWWYIEGAPGYMVSDHGRVWSENNYLDNLFWGTQKDNSEDCRRNGHMHYLTPEEREIGISKMRIPILATNLKTGEQIYFRGQGEAARELGLQQANIWKVLNGQREHSGGYHFEYLEKGAAPDAY